MQVIHNRTTQYSARPIQLSDYLWFAETMEDFPINGGFSMAKAQNEVTVMRRMFRESRGVGMITEYRGEAVGISVYSRPDKRDDYATITVQATHPDHRRQGHGYHTRLLGGYLAFELEGLTHLIYDVELGNEAAEALGASFHAVSNPVAQRKRGKQMPDVDYNRRIFTAENWADFVVANNINLNHYTLEEVP